jgi:hypothetical protein
MRRFALVSEALAVSLVAILPLAGCVSRSTHKQTEALLEECRTDKVSAQTAMTSCEERFAKEVKRWEDMDSVVASVVPGTLAQFKAEREEILKLVPDTTRKEVEQYIDQLTDAMGHGFQVLRDQNENTALALEVAHTKLDALQARADSIGSQTTSINDTLEGSLRDAIEAQRHMHQQAIELVGTVQAFDQQFVTVKDSDSRLKLNRNQRETIEQFHSKLISQLSAIGGGAGAAGGSEKPAEPAEPAAPPSGSNPAGR